MSFKYLLLLLFLLNGFMELESQTIKRTIPLSEFTIKVHQESERNVIEPGSLQSNITPSFIKYDLKEIKLAGSPSEVCIPPHSDYLYCTVPLENCIMVISLSSGNIIDTLKLKYRPRKMILSDDGKLVYVITNDWEFLIGGPGLVYVINSEEHKIISEMFPFATPQIPYVEVGPFFDILINEETSLMYLVDGKYIYVMNIAQNILVDVITKPEAVGYFNTFALDKHRLFGLGEVVGFPFYMINLDNREVKLLQAGGNYNFRHASLPIASPDGRKVFITVYNSNTPAGMNVFDAETGNLETFIPKLTTMGGFIYNEDSSLAFLNQGELVVAKSQIFNLSTLSKIGEITGGGYSGVSSSDDRFIYFPNYDANRSSQVDLLNYFRMGIIVADLKLNYTFTINVTEDSTNSCLYRSIALSSDDQYIAVTNPKLNSVSIVSNVRELVPAAVSLKTPVQNAIVNSTQVTFSWYAIPDITNYELQISKTDNFSEIYFKDSLIVQSLYVINPLKGGQYYWRVRAKNLIGWGEWSEIRLLDVYNSLPVELISFTVNKNNNAIELNWSTVTEVNNHGFEIQKSSEKGGWRIIGFKKGSGTSVQIRNYSFIDKDIVSGKTFYRLKQLDLDGSFRYSDTISFVSDNVSEKYFLDQNFPNPFNPATTFRYSITKSGYVSLKVYDMLGREAATLVSEEQTAGVYTLKFDAGELKSGIYFYKMEAGNFVQSRKFILLR